MSIVIKHNSGRYGNQLFSYFIGRILSDELKFKLYGNNIYDISYDYNQDGYMTYDNPIQIINDDNFKSLNDFNSIISDKSFRKIELHDFLQLKEPYLIYKSKIREWFKPTIYSIPKNNVAIHIRIGDLLYPNHLEHMLPLEYYEKALENLTFDQIIICSDSPYHEYVQYFVKKYNAKIFVGNERETISFLASHNNLILSQGTFSFWAGFFCNGENVINAIPKTGWNSNKDKNLILFENNCRHIQIL